MWGRLSIGTENRAIYRIVWRIALFGGTTRWRQVGTVILLIVSVTRACGVGFIRRYERKQLAGIEFGHQTGHDILSGVDVHGSLERLGRRAG